MRTVLFVVWCAGACAVGTAQGYEQPQPAAATATPAQRTGFWSNFRRPGNNYNVQPAQQQVPQQVMMPEQNLPVEMPTATPKAAARKATSSKATSKKTTSASKTTKAKSGERLYNLPGKQSTAANKSDSASKKTKSADDKASSRNKPVETDSVTAGAAPNDILNTGAVDVSAAKTPLAPQVTSGSETSTPPLPASKSSSASAGSVVTNWPTGKKQIALTYDDGPHPKITPKLLELLAKKKVKATFYLLGEQLREYPGIAQRIAEEGHELANHTTTHKQLSKLEASGIRSELSRTDEMLTSITGTRIATMRPPYGAQNERVRQVCADLGYKVVLWDVDTNDWRGRSSQTIIKTILDGTSDGSIILLHDRYQSTLDSTEHVVDALREKGYEFVTVSELLSQPKVAATTTASAKASTPASAASATAGSGR